MILKNAKYAAEVLKAMSLDGIKSRYSFDKENLTIDGVDDMSVMAAESSLDIVAIDKRDELERVRENRRAEYAKLNQDEMRYDDYVNATATWPDSIAAIKAKFPKPIT